LGLLLCLLFAPAAKVWGQEAEPDVVKRGQYLFAVAGGCACHTVPRETPHAGGRAFPIPLGTVYGTNITKDKETGIGRWSDAEIRDSMVRGVRPNGERLLPVMPYEAYSGMAEEDLNAIIAYLRTLQPVHNENLPLTSWVPFYRSLGTPLWLRLFGRFSTAPAKAPTSAVERGRYLVEHVSLCGDCHTPRNFLGVPNRSLYLAGTTSGPFGETIPNITPDNITGIGEWSREEIAEYLLTGINPSSDYAMGLMSEGIEVTPLGYKDMIRDDALAIADYLKTVPPIYNKVY
jgi:mono/diheme cytochrome c family protein